MPRSNHESGRSYAKAAQAFVQFGEGESGRVLIRQTPAYFRGLLVAQPMGTLIVLFDELEHLGGVLLTLLRPAQDAVEHPFHLIPCHGNIIAGSCFSRIPIRC